MPATDFDEAIAQLKESGADVEVVSYDETANAMTLKVYDLERAISCRIVLSTSLLNVMRIFDAPLNGIDAFYQS